MNADKIKRGLILSIDDIKFISIYTVLSFMNIEPHKIHIVGDTHNVISLKNILSKFNNIISLGDIGAAVSKDIFFNNDLARYRAAWKFYSKKAPFVNQTDLDWFKKINVDSWQEQIDNIKISGKEFTLIMGNSDLAMIDFFSECKVSLMNGLNQKFKFVNSPEIRNINNIQLLLLPFQKEAHDIHSLVKRIDKSKKLFVLTHCPAFENARKEYYVHLYTTIKHLSEQYTGEIVFFHGHMHPSFSYTYSWKNLPNVTFYCPKAEENFNGFGINNHVIRLDTINGTFKLIDSISGEDVEFTDLPESYLHNEDHWNEFDENGNNPNKRG